MANKRELKAAQEDINELGQSVKKSAELISGAVTDSVQKLELLGAAAKKSSDEFYSEMLESERWYLSESARLEAENARMEEENRQLEYQKRLAAAKNATNREIAERNEVLRRKKLADAEYLEQLKQTAEQEKELLKQLKEDIRGIYSDIAEYAAQSMSDIIKAQEKMEEKLTEAGNITRKQIFHGLGEDGGDLTYTILSDIDPQIDALMRYSDALSAVKERIAAGGFGEETSKSILAAVAEMSVEEGTEFAELLGSAGDEEFSAYLSKWVKKQELADSISKQIYSEQFTAAVDDARNYMVEKLTEAGLEIPEDFSLSGAVSAENFGEAFVEEMQIQMEKIREMVQAFSVTLEPVMTKDSAYAAGNGYSSSSTTYILNSSGETVAEQLASARSHSELERMRNG